MIEDLLRRHAEADEDAAADLLEELEGIAGRDPSALTPHLAGLLERGVLEVPSIYVGADDTVRARLIDLIDAGIEADSGKGDAVVSHLSALGYAGGTLAEEAFRRWDSARVTAYGYPAARFALEGGWELRAGKGIREVCAPVAYQLVVMETDVEPVKPEVDQPRDGSVSGRLRGSTCPWCESSLWTVLDLDPSDPRAAAVLAPTGWTGRLEVATCYFCNCYGTVFWSIDSAGRSELSAAHTKRPEYLAEQVAAEPVTVNRLTIGEPRGAHSASAWYEGGSTLGGQPDWIQDWNYPACPECGTTMHYVGQVVGADLAEYTEGAHYVFVHTPCRLAAVEYQQS
ncbi:hypothetical protein [Asanoa hainanensis]|uniref:hypothetical protein n=1 Tax=Asanoa hainanensis TaxID=560556 RepID=UPI000B784D24|nr:hypothetical protein [Asanoa hainanensis]